MLQVPIPLAPATLTCEDYLAHRQELEVTRTAISTMKTLDNHSHNEEWVVQVPAAAVGGQGTVGQEEVQYGANRLTNVGRNWLLKKYVKEHVFPKINFAFLHGDLDFSSNPNSICRFMAEKMKVQEEDVEGFEGYKH